MDSALYKFVEDEKNYYRAIRAKDGSPFRITIPQYYTLDFYGTRKTTHNDIVKVVRILSIDVKNAPKGLFSIGEFSTVTLEAVSFFKKVSDGYTEREELVSHEPFPCKFYNVSGEEIEEVEMKKKFGYVLVGLLVRGLRCTDGVKSYDVIPEKVVFLPTERDTKVTLKFPIENTSKVPAHMLSMFKKLPKEEKTCPICHEEIEVNLAMTPCFHFFHDSCLAMYRNTCKNAKSSKCPLCRESCKE
jgi:hypothetical protein